MAEMDTELEHFTQQHLESDARLSQIIGDDMDDHDMLIHHVAQHDPELYMLDCCLSDILSA